MLGSLGFTREQGPGLRIGPAIKKFGDSVLRVDVRWEHGGSWMDSEGLYVSVFVEGVSHGTHGVDIIYANRTRFDEDFLRERINNKLEEFRTQVRRELRQGLAKFETLEGMTV